MRRPSRTRDRRAGAAPVVRVPQVEVELLRVPCPCRTALRAESAVQANVLVLGHDAPGFEPVGDVEILRQIARWSIQSRSEVGLVAIRRERDAIHRTDVDARVALDAQLRRKYCLHIAVEAALRFGKGLRGIEA